MANTSDTGALGASRTVLSILLKLNPLVGAFILALLVTSLVAPEFLMRALGMGAELGNNSFLLGIRVVMALGIVAVVVTHMVLLRLRAIVDTVRAGDPFIVENATRLQQIAWAVLGGELLHVVIVLVAAGISTDATLIDIRWEKSITRWLVVLLLFVLARVFETGARMREDLEGTI
jgi:hypothetical protein